MQPAGPARPSSIRYRPELDGLRAIAIVPVVLHHSGLVGLSGGFAGVDVFFVISGYLITAIILADLDTGDFSFTRFYERRVRRIVPALAMMLIATGLAGWVILTTADFRQFAQALAASALFGSNLLYARDVDYFADEAGFGPLIHTWTLGVEEQFYLLFPLLLVVLWNWSRKAMLPAIGGIALASFALALVTAPIWPLASFYLLPTRLWELAIGACCALLPALPRPRGALALTGLSAIIVGFVVIDPLDPAPGALFLLPTLGTAMVILFGGNGTLAARLLGSAPLRAIGLASFGTYLWHQPIIALLDYLWFAPVPSALMEGAVVLSCALGALSHRLIETPVRRRRLLQRPGTLASACGLALLPPVLAGSAGYFSLLVPEAYAEAKRHGGLRPDTAEAETVIPAQGPLRFVLYGDSHAAQYFAAIEERLGPGAMVGLSRCLAAGGVTSLPPGHGDRKACITQPETLAALVRERHVPLVIWAQRWERPLFAAATGEALGSSGEAASGALVEAVEDTLATLPQDTRVILMGNSPTAGAAGGEYADGWLRCRRYVDTDCSASYPTHLAEGRRVNRALKALARREPRIAYVDVHETLCPDGRCQLVADGRVVYWDGSHMTRTAADRVVSAIDPALLAP